MNEPKKNAPDLVLLLRMIRYRDWLSEEILQDLLSICTPQMTADEVLDRLQADGHLEEKQTADARKFLKEKSRSLRLNSGDRFRIDRSFGQIALERGWIEVEQLEEALLEQERLRRLRLNFRIGEVLVRLNAMEVDQVRTILREQGFDLACCIECEALVEGASLEGDDPVCPQCGGELRPPVFLDPVPADRFRPRTA